MFESLSGMQWEVGLDIATAISVIGAMLTYQVGERKKQKREHFRRIEDALERSRHSFAKRKEWLEEKALSFQSLACHRPLEEAVEFSGKVLCELPFQIKFLIHETRLEYGDILKRLDLSLQEKVGEDVGKAIAALDKRLQLSVRYLKLLQEHAKLNPKDYEGFKESFPAILTTGQLIKEESMKEHYRNTRRQEEINVMTKALLGCEEIKKELDDVREKIRGAGTKEEVKEILGGLTKGKISCLSMEMPMQEALDLLEKISQEEINNITNNASEDLLGDVLGKMTDEERASLIVSLQMNSEEIKRIIEFQKNSDGILNEDMKLVRQKDGLCVLGITNALDQCIFEITMAISDSL